MNTHSYRKNWQFLRDGGFWAVLLAGPASWLILFFIGLPLRTNAISWNIVIMAIVVYPVLEEIVFRGAVQGYLLSHPALTRSMVGISLACVLTSVLFAAAHLLRQPPLWAALVFLPSLVFGWARERHDSLVSPTLLHMSYNAGFVGLFQTA